MKHRFICLLLWLVPPALILTECAVEKRHYRKGFYITAKKKPADRNPAQAGIPKTEINATGIAEEKNFSQLVQSQIAMAGDSPTDLSQFSYRKKPLLGDSCGDVILFRNGDEVLAKVLEVGTNVIKYRRCDNLTGPVFIAEKKNIFKINYLGGTSEVFEIEAAPDQPAAPGWTPEKPVQKKLNGYAVASFISGLFIWLLFPIPLAIAFGIIALRQIKKQPEKYKGKWMAITGLLLGLILPAILVFYFFVFIASVFW